MRTILGIAGIFGESHENQDPKIELLYHIKPYFGGKIMENGYFWTTPFFLTPPQEVEERAKYLISRRGPTVREGGGAGLFWMTWNLFRATNSYSMEAYYLYLFICLFICLSIYSFTTHMYIYIHVLYTCTINYIHNIRIVGIGVGKCPILAIRRRYTLSMSPADIMEDTPRTCFTVPRIWLTPLGILQGTP